MQGRASRPTWAAQTVAPWSSPRRPPAPRPAMASLAGERVSGPADFALTLVMLQGALTCALGA